MIEDSHLKFCNPENPLHFMTIWTARGHLAKNRLLEQYSRFPMSVEQTDVQRDAAISHARSMLECDTNLMISPLTKRCLWFYHFYFPLPAYSHIVQDLRMQPVSDHAEKTWEVMSDNYDARFSFLGQDENPPYKIFTKLIFQAWGAREAAFKQSRLPLVPPRFVSGIKGKMTQTTQDVTDACTEHPDDVFGKDLDFSMSMLTDSGCQNLLYGMRGQGYVGSESRPYHNMPGQATLDVDLSDLKWTPVDWNPLYRW